MAEDQKDSLDYRMPRDADLWRGEGPWYTRWLRAVPWRRIAVVASVLAFLLLLVALVYSLLVTSYRVPIIIVDTAPYEFPFPPQSWSGEDAQMLEALGNEANVNQVAVVKHATLEVVKQTSDENRAESKRPKSQRLRDVLLQSFPTDGNVRIGNAAVLWISMPGIAYNGEPYLVPPGASPYDEKTWLKVPDLINSIKAEFDASENVKLRNIGLKLIVFDSCRNPTDLRLGWLKNDFVKELSEWWDTNGKSTYKDFAIFSTSGITKSGDGKDSVGEKSWASKSLRGSVFNHYFCRALAGVDVSDRPSGLLSHLKKLFIHPVKVFTDPRSLADIVTLGWLEEQVKGNVNQWATTNRACQQTPLLLVANDDQKRISLTGAAFENFMPQTEIDSGSEAVCNEDRMDLWRTWDQIRESGLYRFDPLAWRGIEQKLVWLDKLAESGAAYTQMANGVYKELNQKISSLANHAAGLQNDKSIVAWEGLLSNKQDSESELKLRSIALAEFLGSETPTTLSAAQNHLQQFRSNPNPQQLQRSRRSLERDGANAFAEAQFLKMLDRYQFPEMWTKPERLQKLLALRTPGQDAGVPITNGKFVGDERVHAWVRGLVDLADDARRNTEDLLFVDGQPNFESQLALAQHSSKSAVDAMTVLQEAMRVRDRVWAELPYYIEWQSARSWAVAKGEGNPIERLFQPLAVAVNDTRKLDEMLSQPMPNVGPAKLEAAIQQIAERSRAVKGEFAELSASMHAECKEIEKELNLGLRTRKIDAALANAALPFDQRSRLFKIQQSTQKIPADSDVKTELVACEYVHNSHYPIDLLFDGKSNEMDLCKRWREVVKVLVDDAIKHGGPRMDLANVDRRVRAAAPFLCDGSFRVSDTVLTVSDTVFTQPIQDLRRYDLRELVLWHAERARRDFWGPAGDQTPYVLTAVYDYLDSARKLSAGASNSGELVADPPNIAAVRRQVGREVADSMAWLQPRANDVVAIEPGGDLKTQLNVAAGNGNLPTAAGTAALYIERDGRRASGVNYTPTASATLPLKSMNLMAVIPGSQLLPASTGDAPTFDVTALFRGHEFHRPFKVEHFGGIVIEDSPHSYGPGRVAIRSPWRGQAIAVILDCSQSMDQLLENDQSRLTVAKESLQDLLSALSSRPNVQIGMRLFGHRVGWSTDRPVRILTSPTFAGPIPPNLTPDRDVERILPLGPFNFTAAQMVFAALRGVEHGWGQSPLYFALQQSLAEDFSGIDADIEKHVIVITDGRNYQARPEAADRVDLAQVVQAARMAGVPIHVLILGSNAPDSHDAVAEFVTLSEQTGGTREEVSGAGDLRTTLQKIVRHDLDQMKDVEGKIVDQGVLGIPLFDAAQRGPQWYTVNYKNAGDRIHLAGSEAIELYVRRGDTRLFAYPFDHDVAGEAWFQIVDSGDSIIERVHRPFATQQNVEFHISLQRSLSDSSSRHTNFWRWTPRPAEAWIEIRPLSASGKASGPTYLFYDANFTPDQPVPLLEMITRDWPKDAPHASVSAWYKTTITEPEYLFPVAEKEQILPDGVTLSMKVNQANGSPRSYQIQLIERHPGPILHVEWLKIIPPITHDTQPARVRRQFDERHGIAIHTFTYFVTDDETLAELQRSKFGVARRSRTLSGATAVPRIEVNISSSGELLQLTRSNSDGPTAGNTSVSAR